MSLIKSVGAGEQSTGFYKLLLDQSLKFDSSEAQYLSRTPASATNQRTFTLSMWVKRTALGSQNFLFSTGADANNRVQIGFENADNINIECKSGGSTQIQYITSRLFRDVSAWYHLVFAFDTTNGTAGNRIRVYVNGSEETSFGTETNPSQNADLQVNKAAEHFIGKRSYSSNYFNGYIAEVNFIDGTALTAASFGETIEGIWTPRDTSGLTFGTNGFHLTFKDDVVSEGFNAVAYTGTGATQNISGLGFSPALVWAKKRSASGHNFLFDVVRGAGTQLKSSTTDAETSHSNYLASFDADGFTIGSDSDTNLDGGTHVAWCWEGGGTPTATNSAGAGATPTAGSVKIDGSNLGSALAGSIPATRLSANTAKGFSVVKYTGNYQAATIAHGLGAAPKWILLKNLTQTADWVVYHSSLDIAGDKYLRLNQTNAVYTSSTVWGGTAATSTVFTTGANGLTNNNGEGYIAYCWTDISGYSKFGSYSGNGSASGPSVTLGFEPSWIMIRRTDSANNWVILDTTRDPDGQLTKYLVSDYTQAESDSAQVTTQVDANGFTIKSGFDIVNASGGTYIYMAFADTREAAFFKDVTTNGNHFTPVNLDYRDSVPDVPTNNFATLNPLDNISTTYSEGNLQYAQSDYNYNSRGTMAVTSGKWYWEIRMSSTHGEFGVCENGKAGQSDPQANIGFNFIYNNGSAGISWKNATAGAQATTGISMTNWSAGDICQIAYDADNGILYHGLNGTYQTSGDPAAGSGGLITGIAPQFGGTMVPFFGSGTGNARTWVVNFGQDSSFAGNHATANSNADGNGHGSFAYAPPSGFLALCSQNLPDVDIIDGTEHFNTVLYTGNSGTQSVTGVGFQPDWTWIKPRNTAENNVLHTSVQPNPYNYMISNGTGSENTNANFDWFKSFDSDGFTVAYLSSNSTASNNWNGTSNYVSWNWLAGAAFSNDASATGVGSIDSSGEVNTTAGFSIVSYTGNGATGATVEHGLSSALQFYIIKNRDASFSWTGYHEALGAGNYIQLDSTGAASSTSDWNSTAPTSSVFTVSGDEGRINKSGTDYIAYCFHSVEGYSKVGSFVANGNADGPFVYTGFRPAFVIVKNTTGTESWGMGDSTRSSFNTLKDRLYPNLSNAEYSTGDWLDLVSNGFKHRGTAFNTSGATYIYLAFAESPFKFANAR